jgi:hypothetical protein
MADDTPPPDLVQARIDFLTADGELARIAAEAPGAFAEDGAVLPVDAELAARMNVERARMRDAAEYIAGHAWMTASGGWFSNWQKVNAAAKPGR